MCIRDSTRTGSQSLGNVTVDLSPLNSVPTTITVTDESTQTVCYPLFTTVATGNLEPKTGTNIKFNSASGQLEAGSFKKTGGTSSEFLKADGSIDSTSYLSSVALNDLSDVDATTNLANGKILKYDSTANSGSGGWLVADDNTSGGGSANFTGLSDTPSAHSNNKWLKSDGSALVWADAPMSIEEVQDIVGGMFTGNTETNITATYEDSDGTIDLVVSGSDTTYDLTAGADSGNAKVTLTPSSGTDDVVTFSAGGGISYAVTGNTIQIISSNSLGGLSDVTISGSPTPGEVIKYVSGTGWTNSTDATSGGSDGNDYVTNLSLSGTTLTAEFGNTSLNQTIDLASINSNTQLSTEQVQDIVGAMFSGNTETNITATYQDSDGTIDLDVSGGGTDTTYDLTAAASSGDAKITLTDSNGSPDDVTLTAGGGISYAVTGNTI